MRVFTWAGRGGGTGGAAEASACPRVGADSPWLKLSPSATLVGPPVMCLRKGTLRSSCGREEEGGQRNNPAEEGRRSDRV